MKGILCYRTDGSKTAAGCVEHMSEGKGGGVNQEEFAVCIRLYHGYLYFVITLLKKYLVSLPVFFLIVI